MISHADTMTTSIDEHSIGVVESLIKGNPLYYKHVQHAPPEFLPGHLLAIHLRLSPLLILQQHIKTGLGQLAGLPWPSNVTPRIPALKKNYRRNLLFSPPSKWIWGMIPILWTGQCDCFLTCFLYLGAGVINYRHRDKYFL